jgi:hypothetical protein
MYIKGDYWMVCDRCGFDYRRSQMRETWDHLWVCRDCWEPKHPQLTIKAKKDDQRVPVARPDKSSAIGSTTTAVAAADYSKILTLTSTSDVSSGDSIGVTLDNGDVQWVQVAPMYFPGGTANSIYGDYGSTLKTTMQSAFSVSMYFTAREGYPSNGSVLCGSRNNDTTDFFQVYQNTDTDGQFTVIYKANNLQARIDTGAILVDGPNPKHHIIVSVSSDYIRLYIDNVLQSSSGSNDGDMSAVTMSGFDTDKNMYVGAVNYTTLGDLFHFDGKIDNFQVHTSAISTLSTYGYSGVIGLSENLRDSVASGNEVFISGSSDENFLSSAVSVDDL